MNANSRAAVVPHAGIPSDVRCAQDYENLAPRHVDASTLAYIAGGSGRGVTAAANLAAFAELAIVPRLLRDVRAAHTRRMLCGELFEHPLLLAPVAHQKLVCAEGELASARAAQATDSGIVCSTLSSYRLEDIAALAGPRRWFQLYFQPERNATLDLVNLPINPDRLKAAHPLLPVDNDSNPVIGGRGLFSNLDVGLNLRLVLLAAPGSCRLLGSRRGLSSGLIRTIRSHEFA